MPNHFTVTDLQAAFENRPNKNPQMRNLSQDDITQLSVDMILIRRITRELLDDNKTVKHDAIELMQYA